MDKMLKCWEKRDADTVRFGVISDVHVQDTTFRLDMALEAFEEIGGLNGLLLIGDIMFQDGCDVEKEKYNIVKRSLDEKAKGIPYAYAIGNHEFPILSKLEICEAEVAEMFARTFDQPVKCHKVIDGYHFIIEKTVTRPDIDWIIEEIEKVVNEDKEKGALKPVFLLMHDGLRNMNLYRGGVQKWSAELQEKLRNYPQVIALTGHIHVTAHDPNVIAQDGFTEVQVPCLGEIGYLAGDGLFEEYFVPGDPEAMMIEIKENIVYVYRLNLDKNEYIGKPFVIDISKLVRNNVQHYNYKKRREVSNIPYFKEDVDIDINKMSDGCVEIGFPKAYNDPIDEFSQDGFVISYRVDVYEEGTDTCVYSKHVVTDYYKVCNTDDMSERLFKKIPCLEAGKKYIVSVTPISPFRKEGSAIRRSI